MRLHFLSAAALLGLVACQQSSPALPDKAATGSSAPVSASPTIQATAAPRPAAAPPSPALRTFLAKYDVAALLEKRPDSESIMNGFYGPNHYRVEFAMLSVKPDATVPGLLHVRGKDRYKGVVTPFEGEIWLTELVDQPRLTSPQIERALDEGYEIQNEPTAQSALGRFELREAADHKGAGIISGRVAIDFYRDGDKLLLNSQSVESAAQGGSIKFEGTWTSNHTHKVQPVVWVDDIFKYGPQVFNEFFVGGRERDFNPKYAKLGWNTYWQNEEWWVDPADASETVIQAAAL